MFSNQAAELSLNRPVAAVEAVRGDKVDSKFLAGTSSVRVSEDNHLLLLRFHSEANHLGVDGRLSHPTGPVELIRTSPSDPSYVLTTAENDSGAATLWKIPSDVLERSDADIDEYDDDDDDDDEDYDDDGYYDRGAPNHAGTDSDRVTEMEEQATLQAFAEGGSDRTAKVADVAWRGGDDAFDEEPSSGSTMGDVATLSSDGTLTQWDVAFGASESTRRCDVDVSSTRTNLPPRMAWDPHHPDVTSVSTGDIVQLVDWREAPGSSPTTTINCDAGNPHHRYGITDLDYNPNKPNVLVTSGKDGLLKFWDLRNTASGYYDVDGVGDEDSVLIGGGRKKKKQRPLLVARGGHRHWTNRVFYNPFHDQLVLSAGTDSLVNLWRISTISSAPLLTLDDDEEQPFGDPAAATSFPEDAAALQDLKLPEGPNLRVSRYEHIDSVNDIAWGAADAWIYVSASYDGKVVLNHVPSKEKYKILL